MADIVTLRAHLGRRDSSPSTHWDGCITAHPICALAWALDEITRLRTAGDALLAALRAETVNGAMAVCDGTNEAMETWEADRG